ncbi:helix-turn-helix transcriptional regulator [Streptomyces sp. NPDC046161]|uniref:helix-turn-helix transcriptional regulator n=1 Tax=Streptomyces sp. NPDC046161 TaxID=3155132 RepID=UPI0033E9E74C
MTRDWERLARAIEEARDAKGLTQVALAEAAEVSESTVQNLESGATRKRTPSTLPKIEAALGWAPGSGIAVLAGGDPTPENKVSQSEDRDLDRSDLPLRIVDELKNGGQLVDTAVIRLPTKGDVRMTVVVRGAPDASPEEIQQALEAWRRAERKLQNLPGDEDEPRAANEA